MHGRLVGLSVGAAAPLASLGLLAVVGAAPFQAGAPAAALGIGAIAAGAAVLIGGLATARSIGRRVRSLEAAVERIGAGDFSARAHAGGGDELARLAARVNGMAERLEAREARMTELDRLKSEFVSGVSHELRTPLTTIKALTRLLARDSLAPEKRREYLDTIAAECDRQIDLVLNLLDLSRIEGGVFHTTPGRVAVPEIVKACVKAAGRGVELRGHELRLEIAPDLPDARADAKAFGRVLGNVLENAVKYTPDGGRIVVSARGEGEWVAVSVSDNGRGIPPEDVPRLFDKFHRGRVYAAAAPQSGNPDEVDVSGVGLGLYLARNVMEQMGGRIGVETELGRGSTFTLYLPKWKAGGRDGAGEAERDAGAAVGG